MHRATGMVEFKCPVFNSWDPFISDEVEVLGFRSISISEVADFGPAFRLLAYSEALPSSVCIMKT